MDKATKFFIENYPGVKAVLDLNEHAQEKLPREVLKLLYGALSANFRNWNWGAKDRINHINSLADYDEEEFYWSDVRWLSKNEEMGTYFCVGNITSSSIFDPDDDDRPFLLLYHDKDVNNLTLNALKQAVNNARPQLNEFGDVFNYRGDNGTSLVKQYINEIITIDNLKYQDDMLQKFLVKARGFTEALAPIVYKLAKLD